MHHTDAKKILSCLLLALKRSRNTDLKWLSTEQNVTFSLILSLRDQNSDVIEL